jgi:hypothetical protein
MMDSPGRVRRLAFAPAHESMPIYLAFKSNVRHCAHMCRRQRGLAHDTLRHLSGLVVVRMLTA